MVVGPRRIARYKKGVWPVGTSDEVHRDLTHAAIALEDTGSHWICVVPLDRAKTDVDLLPVHP
jgi:hypothetical protein